MPQAQWTWLVYMAGDNNLEGAGRVDLREMQEVGSTSDVNVIVQFDTEENKTLRYLVEKRKLTTLETLPGQDSGDPKVLTSFIQWGMEAYPAKHFILVVWNHGGGWENLPPDFDYGSYRAVKSARSAKLRRVRRSIFRTTIRAIANRNELDKAIAIDCGSKDYLDNRELRTAVAAGFPDGRLDIFGCDACLMNMLEIAYEMKDTARFMVGSEQTEPAAGWPYADILRELAADPAMAPEVLANVIVERFGEWYREKGKPSDGAATQSALDLRSISGFAARVDGLASELEGSLPALAGSISLARERSQKFDSPEYIDLVDFARELQKRIPSSSPVASAAREVERCAARFVTKNETWGSSVKRANGVSIYFPESNYSPDYADLDYSKNGRWKDFLEAYFRS
jgi:hypothetical protein